MKLGNTDIGRQFSEAERGRGKRLTLPQAPFSQTSPPHAPQFSNTLGTGLTSTGAAVREETAA